MKEKGKEGKREKGMKRRGRREWTKGKKER